MYRHLTRSFKPVVVALAVTVGLPCAADQTEPVDARVRVTTPAELSLPDVLERVRVAAAAGQWTRAGWTDPLVEGWVNHVLDAVRAAGPGRDVHAAVKFSDYPGRGVAGPQRAAPFGAAPVVGGGGSLIVTRRLDETRLSNTLALVDGDASVAFADNCVIVARGAVYIAHGGGNVVVAGRFVHVSHDGSTRQMAAARARQAGRAAGGPPVPPPSLIVSGGTINVSHATDTALAAGARLEVSHAIGCVILNPPADLQIGHKDGCLDVRTERVRLGDPPKPHPLAADVSLQSVNGDKGIVVFRYKGRRYVAEKGKPITDEADRPIPGLDGWVVTVAGSGYAVLGSERERASVVMPEARQ